MPSSKSVFRVGKVQAYLRGKIWYLCYHEDGRRRRPRVGPDKEAARQLAAQVNAQIEAGARSALSFEPIAIDELRKRWLDHHEQVLRSSVRTIHRYRCATDHLLAFLAKNPVRHASRFQPSNAEAFVRHLRSIRISPNGHANTKPRALMDKGLRFILECCRTMFNFAAKRRHLSPYAENPFVSIEIERIPIDDARPIRLLAADEQQRFLDACDTWQFPLFLTLMMSGIRPGELCHLLLPDDVDLTAGVLRIRNKARLGWQVKTRNEREIPLLPTLVDVLGVHLDGRRIGPLFRRRCWQRRSSPFDATAVGMEGELLRRVATAELTGTIDRRRRLRIAQTVWRDAGAIREDRVRLDFLRLMRRIGLPGRTAPKELRHLFATTLQETNVDPLIRNLLMGHAASDDRRAGHGLGMTAVYTHTRPETIRRQLEGALASTSAAAAAVAWLKQFQLNASVPLGR